MRLSVAEKYEIIQTVTTSETGEFKDKTEFVHQIWQTDFTYFKIIG